MPVPPIQRARVIIAGDDLDGGTWSTGFAISDVEGTLTDQATAQGYLEGLNAPIATWWDTVRQTVSQDFSYSRLSMYVYAPGQSTAINIHRSDPTTPSPGLITTSSNPLDVCLVQSLRTAKAGRANRGRMYIPFHSPVSSHGHANSSVVDSLAAATAALLSGVNGLSTELPVVILSSATGSATPVTSVVVDDIPDVQRRRERKIVSAHTATQAVTPV